ncbi:DUF1905 domain-containing protein [Ornithinimicrobium pratense]|uniref:DUF1905 domain-containing protein n=1 Tax=Ornithinimicrobium pratense TaxID=2593973 RepID=UPI001EE1F222|nr:DUF1905 domain-containing protein [Ornithinimicrobium pratense]
MLAFNHGKRVPVIVTIDGGYTYKTTIGVMGGRYLVSFNAETRKQTGRGAGDEVRWTWWLTPSAERPAGRPGCAPDAADPVVAVGPLGGVHA